MSSENKTVLITAVGGAGTIEILKSLQKTGNYRLVGMDAFAYARGFSFCDRAYVVPLAVESHFKESVSAIMKSEKPDFVVPLVDEEILLFHDLVATIESQRPTLLTPKRDFCEITLDKWRTFLELTKVGLPTPETVLASQATNVVFPAVIKPRDGRGSRDLGYLNNAEDLEFFLKKSTRPAGDYIVQRHVFGKEYTVSAVVGLDGRILAIVPKEVVVKKGITQVGVTRRNSVVEELCREVQRRLRADGPFNVQLILQENQIPLIVEINPRYSTTVALTIASGINEVEAVMRHALGEDVGPLEFQPDLLMFRYQTQVFTAEKQWPPGNVVVS